MTTPTDLTPELFRPIPKIDAEAIIDAIRNAGGALAHGELKIDLAVAIPSDHSWHFIGSMTIDVQKEQSVVQLFAALCAVANSSNGSLQLRWTLDGAYIFKQSGAIDLRNVNDAYSVSANAFATVSKGVHTFALEGTVEPYTDAMTAVVQVGSSLLAQEVGP